MRDIQRWERLVPPFPHGDPRLNDSIACFSTSWTKVKAPEGFRRTSWEDVQVEKKMTHILEVVVAHPQFVAAIQAARQRVSLLLRTGKALGLHGIARSNGGKTTLIHYLQAEMPPLEGPVPGQPSRGMVAISVPDPCDPEHFLRAILRTIGDPDWQGPAKYLRDRVVYLLKKLGVKVLCLDNVQDIPTSRGEKGLKKIGAFLRNLIDDTGTVVILLGTAPAEIVIDVYDQIKRRAPGRINLSDYDVSTAEGMAKFLRFIHEFEKVLPMPKESALVAADGRLGHRLALAADGEVGATKSLLLHAVQSACAAGREVLTKEDLSWAFAQLYAGYSEHCNPFSNGFVFRRLNQPGDPHYVNHRDWTRKYRRAGEG